MSKPFASFRYGIDSIEFDDFGAVPIDDPRNNTTDTESIGGRVGLAWDLMDGRLKNETSVQAYENRRDTFSGFPGWFDGRRYKIDHQSTYRFNERIALMVGADAERTEAETSGLVGTQSADIVGAFTQLLVSPFTGLSLSLGARIDDHETFGSFDTYRASGAYTIAATNTTLKASVGTGFRAPSLFELFDPTFGNIALTPEESFSWDAGIEQRLWDNKIKLSALYFVLDLENLIGFNFPAGYINVPATTERDGVELEAVLNPVSWLSLRTSYTYTDARNAAGLRDVRIPRHDIGVAANIRPMDKLNIALNARIVADTVDTFARTALDDYVLINAKVSYDVADNLQIYTRIENLLDDQYQTVEGYGTSDVALYAGVKGHF
jgi:vitamin B12 transporter